MSEVKFKITSVEDLAEFRKSTFELAAGFLLDGWGELQPMLASATNGNIIYHKGGIVAFLASSEYDHSSYDTLVWNHGFETKLQAVAYCKYLQSLSSFTTTFLIKHMGFVVV